MIEQGKLVFSGSIDEFNNYVAPSSLLVKLDITPPLEALKAIDGVLQVEEIKPRNYRLQFDASKDISEHVVQLSVANNWQLAEIQLERLSLDATIIRKKSTIANMNLIYENNIKDNKK